MLRAQRGRELEQEAAVDEVADDVAHVVDLALVGRHEARRVARRRLARRGERQRAAGLAGQVREHVAHEVARGDVVDGVEVRDAGLRVDLRPAELDRR